MESKSRRWLLATLASTTALSGCLNDGDNNSPDEGNPTVTDTPNPTETPVIEETSTPEDTPTPEPEPTETVAEPDFRIESVSVNRSPVRESELITVITEIANVGDGDGVASASLYFKGEQQLTKSESIAAKDRDTIEFEFDTTGLSTTEHELAVEIKNERRLVSFEVEPNLSQPDLVEFNRPDPVIQEQSDDSNGISAVIENEGDSGNVGYALVTHTEDMFFDEWEFEPDDKGVEEFNSGETQTFQLQPDVVDVLYYYKTICWTASVSGSIQNPNDRLVTVDLKLIESSTEIHEETINIAASSKKGFEIDLDKPESPRGTINAEIDLRE